MSNYVVDGYTEGKVTGIKDYGIFVTMEDGYTGLIHISEISNSFVKDINKYVILGEIIKMKITSVDDNNKHLCLSIKGLNYRIHMHGNIPEVGKGFEILKNNLPIWIDEYEKNTF